MLLTRRALLTTVADATTTQVPGSKPATKVIDSGRGVLQFSKSNPGVERLVERLISVGFIEEVEESLLIHQYGQGVFGDWVLAEVVWGFFENAQGTRALLTHVLRSSDPSLSRRRAQAHVWKEGRSGDIDYTMEAAESGVARL